MNAKVQRFDDSVLNERHSEKVCFCGTNHGDGLDDQNVATTKAK